MIRKSRARASSLFLMELILAILFFSAASAICVQFFVRSHLLNLDSDNLSHAVNECSGAAEAVCSSDGISETAALLQSLYPDGIYSGTEGSVEADDSQAGEIRIYYDGSFQPCGEENGAYMMVLRLTTDGSMLHADIQMQTYIPEDGGGTDTIYGLNIQHHIAGRTGYEKR